MDGTKKVCMGGEWHQFMVWQNDLVGRLRTPQTSNGACSQEVISEQPNGSSAQPARQSGPGWFDKYRQPAGSSCQKSGTRYISRGRGVLSRREWWPLLMMYSADALH